MGIFELRLKEEGRRGEKCFISVISGMRFNGLINIEKYVAIRNVLNHFTLEIFSSNIDFTQIKGNRKNFYLGDDNDSSYYLLSFIPLNSEPEIKKMGEVVFVNGTTYLPITLAYDLCSDQKSKKLIEVISKVNV